MRINKKILVAFLLMLALSLGMAIPAYAADFTEAQTKATALKELGLFKGVSETDFELNRAPTRTEALVMLIRLLGKEPEALNGTWSHPFTDVPAWAKQYIGYAYEKGLTKGVSDTTFGSGNADSNMYLTFVLRALNYSDSAGDFTWNAPNKLAKAVGILPDNVNTENFLRADVALVSWAALEADLKTGSLRVAKKLMKDGIFTSDDYGKAILLVNAKNSTPVSVSTLAELQTALTNTSVKAITVNSIGNPLIVTDSLTIPAGVTVTINRGSDFYVEGTLTNNGTIFVMAADAITTDFINYAVLSVQNGGKLINNGAIHLQASLIEDTRDNGPIGGQLRLINGTVTNNGSVFLKRGFVNTHGGLLDVVNGTFTNDAVVIIDGFFLRITEGSFLNNKNAVVINNSTIIQEAKGVFTNNGTLSGNAVTQ